MAGTFCNACNRCSFALAFQHLDSLVIDYILAILTITAALEIKLGIT